MTELKGGLRTILLLSGIIAPILYVATDIAAGALLPGYNFASQSTGALSTPGASTRTMVAVLFLVVYSLICVFGATLWLTAGGSWSLRLIAGLLIFSAVLQAVAVAFFPYRPGETVTSLNTLVQIPSIVGWFLVIALEIVAFHNWFRYFSLGLLLAIVVEDLLATVGASLLVPGGHSGSLIGLQERFQAYGVYLWIALLAVLRF
jgi:hypothetical protein